MTACNMAPVLVQQPSLNTVSLQTIASKGGVFLLPPRVTYERVENGETFDGDLEYFAQSPGREVLLSLRLGRPSPKEYTDH